MSLSILGPQQIILISDGLYIALANIYVKSDLIGLRGDLLNSIGYSFELNYELTF